MGDVIRVALVEDEPLPRRRLRRMLEASPGVRVVGEAAGRAEAVAWLRRHGAELDALFLDIELGDGTGFDVLDELARVRERLDARAPRADGPRAPEVVFVTAFDRFAVRAFEVRALDYLLKPFEERHVARALARVRERLDAEAGRGTRAGAGEAARLAALRALVAELRAQAGARAGAEWSERIPVRARGEVRLVPAESVDWLASADNYVELHCGAEVHLVRGSMAAFEERLDPRRFARIHRRTIVNLRRVRALRYDATGEPEVVLEDGTTLRVGRAYRDRLGPGLGR